MALAASRESLRRASRNRCGMALPCKAARSLLYAEQGLGDTLPVHSLCAPGARARRPRDRGLPAGTGPSLEPLSRHRSTAGAGQSLPSLMSHAPVDERPAPLRHDPGHRARSGALPLRRMLAPRLLAPAAPRPRDVPDRHRWQGSPTYRRDRQRSIPLEQFAPLAQLPGVELVSLQKGPGTEQLGAVADRFAVTDLGSQLDASSGPFLETAAVMHNLDLVIAPDTALAHLAGALGVPVWLALPFAPEWRWLLTGGQSLVSQHAPLPPEGAGQLVRTLHAPGRRCAAAIGPGAISSPLREGRQR